MLASSIGNNIFEKKLSLFGKNASAIMALSKVQLKNKSISNHSCEWEIFVSEKRSWNFGSEMNDFCNGCNQRKLNILNFRWDYGSRFCLECFEYVFANTALSKDVIHFVMKRNKDLRKKLKKQKKDLKVEYQSYKELLMKSEEESVSATADVNASSSTTALSSATKQFLQNTESSFRWTFREKEMSLCSNWKGSCKKCNKENIKTIYIYEQEHRVSFCLKCIRSFFDEIESIDVDELIINAHAIEEDIKRKQDELQQKQKELEKVNRTLLEKKRRIMKSDDTCELK
jgi:hypothetical protein